jgi:transcriptional regulator with XRE-family HTH domain
MSYKKSDPEIKIDLVKRLREQLVLSQTEAAARAGMSVQQWHNIESGDRTSLTPRTLLRVARALECTMEELVNEARKGAKR